jgi:hypothetical protein
MSHQAADKIVNPCTNKLRLEVCKSADRTRSAKVNVHFFDILPCIASSVVVPPTIFLIAVQDLALVACPKSKCQVVGL